MLPRASPALTRIGFRRDVRLFFGSLVGFLSVLIILLLLLLQSFLENAREAKRQNWSNIVRMTIDEMERSNALADPGTLQTRLGILQARYGIAGINVTRAGRTISIGVPASDANVERMETWRAKAFIVQHVVGLPAVCQDKIVTVGIWTEVPEERSSFLECELCAQRRIPNLPTL